MARRNGAVHQPNLDQLGPGAGGAGNGEPAAAEMQSEEELRKLAHERVWGQAGRQFEKLESALLHEPAVGAPPTVRPPRSSTREA